MNSYQTPAYLKSNSLSLNNQLSLDVLTVLTVLVEKLGMTGSELGQAPKDTVAIESAQIEPKVAAITRHRSENFILKQR